MADGPYAPTAIRRRGALRACVLPWIVAVLLLWAAPAAPATGQPQAPTGPVATTITVSGATLTDTTLTVAGTLVDASGAVVVNVPVAVSIAQGPTTTSATTAQGFTATLARPAAGTAVVTASFAGTAVQAPSSVTVQVPIPSPSPVAPTTALNVTVTPTHLAPGAVLHISGTLTANGAGLPSAQINVSTDWGALSSVSATDGNGAFDETFLLPTATVGDPTLPKNLKVTVSFPGEGRYPKANSTTTVTLDPPPTPTPTPTPTRTPTPVPTPTPTVASPSVVADAQQPRLDTSPVGRTVLLAVAGVAVIAVGSLLTMALLARRRLRLDADERRGFGSDFGQDPPAPRRRAD